MVVEPLRELRRQWSEPALAPVLADALAQLGRTEEGIAGLQVDVEAGIANHWTHYSLSQHLAALGRLRDASLALRQSHTVQGWSSSARCGYIFTQDDFTVHLAQWQKWFAAPIPQKPLQILQIGCWQGACTLWLLDEVISTRGGEITWVGPWQDAREPYLLAPLGLTLERLVQENLVRSGRADHVCRLAGDPVEQLSGLPPAGFDCICLQAGGSSGLWMQQAIHAHRLLAPGGFLILTGQPDGHAILGGECSNARDFFVSLFEDDYQVWQEGGVYLLRSQQQVHLPIQVHPKAAAGDVRSDALLAGITLQVLWETESLLRADRKQEALELLASHLPAWMDEHRRVATARLVTTLQLSSYGAWKQAEALHHAGVNDVDKHNHTPDSLAAELSILRTESELLSHELSLALSQGSLAAPIPAAVEAQGDGRQHWQSLSRSQLGQDLWVLEQLAWKRDGFFVEFGATDGVLLSNSWLLEKHFAWRGICAEPNPKLFARLQQNRSCTLSRACVYRNSGERMKFVLADAYGGLEDLARYDQHVEKRKAYAAVGDVIEVTTISLMDLLDQQDAPALIDYLSIDTEGSELAILEGIDWGRYQFRCITVEHNFTEQRQGIQKLLEAQGYQCRKQQWDDWYAKAI